MPGRIELLNIDCMEYMATLPDGAFDLAIVDPPYGRGEDGGTNRCHGVKQKNGTVLRCMDGGYAKKDWDRERKESAPDKYGMKNLICPRCGGHSYYKLDDPAQATKGQ